jgi:hypothetical protein
MFSNSASLEGYSPAKLGPPCTLPRAPHGNLVFPQMSHLSLGCSQGVQATNPHLQHPLFPTALHIHGSHFCCEFLTNLECRARTGKEDDGDGDGDGDKDRDGGISWRMKHLSQQTALFLLHQYQGCVFFPQVSPVCSPSHL